jgi:hypothetical protein
MTIYEVMIAKLANADHFEDILTEDSDDIVYWTHDDNNGYPNSWGPYIDTSVED